MKKAMIPPPKRKFQKLLRRSSFMELSPEGSLSLRTVRTFLTVLLRDSTGEEEEEGEGEEEEEGEEGEEEGEEGEEEEGKEGQEGLFEEA